MRPLRFLLLLGLFVVLPIILTCVSLFSSRQSTPEPVHRGYSSRSSRFRALFSFTTPSSLFPPSAIISLTDDNTTSFIARPAAFGPSLSSHGLSGQLWVGKGFGEDVSLANDELRFNGFELGCSDVPGIADIKRRPDNGAVDAKSTKVVKEDMSIKGEAQSGSNPFKRDVVSANDLPVVRSENDGTDDYLHHPLPDSNPASPEKPGEPASIHNQDKSRQPTHADIESLQESADIAGKIVMLSRGGCGFLEKVKWAQRRGGIALIVGDNEPGNPLTIMYAKGDTSNVTIPAVFTSYYSAQLLSTLIPSEEKHHTENDPQAVQSKDGKSTGAKVHGNPKQSLNEDEKSNAEKGWVKNVLSAVGLEDDTDLTSKDSRRPPGSGNIDWVLLEDWDEDKPGTLTTSTQIQRAATASAKVTRSTSATSQAVGNDDFIIGVQDWRDTELIAPKSTATHDSKKQKGKAEVTASQTSASTSSVHPTATALNGGIITPGSGEYDHQSQRSNGRYKSAIGQSSTSTQRDNGGDHRSLGQKIASFFHLGSPKSSLSEEYIAEHDRKSSKDASDDEPKHKPKEHHGLWVTLTPASSSTNPFFDTLLVLVVSPLVTLTFVYGLLLLRSRIRRRRWRAPKSIVERLPVRTYHTMSDSSTTSSALTSQPPSSNSSPSIGPMSHNRIRPRSQTTTGVFSSSAPTEKASVRHSPQQKRYTGRQVECVVCLEEYVDGESKVMSLPCGHEFHVDCITPWLVTRRRTCPICKGDVVRSLARRSGDSSSIDDDAREDYEQTSDDVQERAAMTENSSESAAIPIPVSGDIATASDIERGSDVETPLLGSTPRAQQGTWRGLLSGSLGRLSGDTVWRSSVNDRNR